MGREDRGDPQCCQGSRIVGPRNSISICADGSHGVGFSEINHAVQRSDIAMLIVSIALEAAVAFLAVLAARRGKPYVYGLAFTFGAYVLYDLARLLHWNVQAGILSWLFLLATISALIAVWGLYRK
jgi:hypothetical protein